MPSETKHTPGPWEVWTVDYTGDKVSLIAAYSTEVNAKMCAEVHHAYGDRAKVFRGDAMTNDRIRAALRKARGE